MPTYRLTVEYDGTDFSGWQLQSERRTAMGVLLDALEQVSGERPVMTAAGRTDAGAHAHGQVVGCALQRPWDPERLRAALNAVLPADVAVVDVGLRAPGFHARRDALDRTYRYLVALRDTRTPLLRRHAWTVCGPLDVEAMRRGAAHLVGTHDFAAFGSSPRAGGSTVRTVHECTVTSGHIGASGAAAEPGAELVVITVRADAFLRGMMRAFTGALVRIGQGRSGPDWISQLLERPAGRDPHVSLAPAAGLHQWSVRYAWDTIAEASAA